jgi:hypothetical protein
MFPHYTDPETEVYTMDFAIDALKEAGRVVRSLKQRITAHPGQYVQIGAKDPQIFQKSYEDLQMHADIMNAMDIKKIENTNIKLNGNTVVSVKGASGTSSDNSISRACTNSVFKPGNITGIYKRVSFKHILPSIYMSPPANIGSSGNNGCIMLNYVYIKPNYINTNESFTNFTESFISNDQLNNFYNIENFTTAQTNTININTLANYSMSVLTTDTRVPHLFNETPPTINRTDSLPTSGRPAASIT